MYYYGNLLPLLPGLGNIRFLEDRFFSSEIGGYMTTQNCAFEKYKKKKYSLHFDTDESADQLIVMK